MVASVAVAAVHDGDDGGIASVARSTAVAVDRVPPSAPLELLSREVARHGRRDRAKGPRVEGGKAATGVSPSASPADTGVRIIGGSRTGACFPGVYESCTADTSADEGTSRMGVHMALTAPNGGAGLGVGSAQGTADLLAVHHLDHDVEVATYRVTVRFSDVSMGRTVQERPVPLAPIGPAEVRLQVVALHAVCGGHGCFTHAVQPVNPAHAGRDITVTIRLTKPSGDLPAGDVLLKVGLYGRAELGGVAGPLLIPDVGSVHARARAALVAITLV